MNPQVILDPERWARETFGPSKLKDIGRTGRAVQVASKMAKNPSASLPAQMQTWKEGSALDRMLDEDEVTFEALMHPHVQQTREFMEAEAVVLLGQDPTQIDLCDHRKLSGLGQIGNAKGRGLRLANSVGGRAGDTQHLGMSCPETVCASPRSPKASNAIRDGIVNNGKPTGGWRWSSALAPLAPRADGCMWEIEARTCFPCFRTCLAAQTHFVVRAAQNRRVQAEEEEVGHLLERVRTWPSQDQRPHAGARLSWTSGQEDHLADQLGKSHPPACLE